jgi:hypothetical protein
MGIHNSPMPGLQELAAALGGEVSNGQALCPGPGHSPKDRSLSVKLDGNGGFIVHSFSGDDPIACKDHVRQKAGLGAFKPNGNGRRKSMSADELIARVTQVAGGALDKPTGQHVGTFDYTAADGTVIYQVLKYDNPRTYPQRRPDGKGGYIWKLDGVRRVLYRLHELLKYPSATVFVTEGEKDADRVASLGHCATTVAHGKWTDECVKALAGRHVIILQDNDDAGAKRALESAQQLHGTAASIRSVLLPDLPHKGDVSDWLDADPKRAEKLVDVCFDVPLWEPGEEGAAEAPSPAGDQSKDSTTQQTGPIIKSSKQFITGFVPPEYVVVGLLQRRFFYSLTGQTGAGKTAIGLLLAARAALGQPFAGLKTKPIRVLYLAAENADDVRMRWIALAEQTDFDIDTIQVYFVEGRFTLSTSLKLLRAEAERHGGEFGLVIVDTGPTFFEGIDENANKELGDHARLLRGLIDTIPDGPCVLAMCHPTKNAGPDQLIPRGGGAFLNETDGNLTAAKNDSTVELHWQGKFRGPEFAPKYFLVKTVTHRDLKDSDGNLIPTVVAEHITEQAKEDITAAAQKDEDRVLAFVNANPDASLAKIALAMDWKLFNGDPNKMRVKRCFRELVKGKLLKETRAGKYVVTPEGEKAVEARKEP